MTEQELRREICRVGASLHARGYAHGSAGNISARLGDHRILITPTDACLGNLDPDRLALVDGGQQVSGDPASKTLFLHSRIYAGERDEAHCVIHTHATHLVALTLAGVWSDADILPPITPYYVMKVGHVPLIPYHRPGDPAAARLVAVAIAAGRERGTPLRAVMLDRLGPNVWHRTPAEASALLEELEETARLWLMTRAVPLPEERIAELRQQFGARW